MYIAGQRSPGPYKQSLAQQTAYKRGGSATHLRACKCLDDERARTLIISYFASNKETVMDEYREDGKPIGPEQPATTTHALKTKRHQSDLKPRTRENRFDRHVASEGLPRQRYHTFSKIPPQGCNEANAARRVDACLSPR